MKTNEAIERAKAGKSLKGVVLEDISSVQVTVTDALALSNGGIVVPESNVYYDDESIEYDEDIDGVKWSSEFVNLTWEEKQSLCENSSDEISMKIKLEDSEMRTWLLSNKERIESVLTPILSSLYKAELVIKE